MKIRILIRGILGYFPKLLNFIKRRKEKTGTVSARYCYSVWLRHLIHMHDVGLNETPKVVAEFGPGASLGIGLAAILSGADELIALDVLDHADVNKNLEILDELVLLFSNRTSIPGLDEFPKISPELTLLDFPSNILMDQVLEKALDKNRLKQIKQALKGQSNTIKITYLVPWNKVDINLSESIDLIFSQAVMEHILNIEQAYEKMFNFLRKGGVMSHQIDYKAHETHDIWNGHWGYSSFIWNLMLKGRLYPINRFPHSHHINAIKSAGFRILRESLVNREDGISKVKDRDANSIYLNSDYKISGALIIAKK